jgi:hypothetical protein
LTEYLRWFCWGARKRFALGTWRRPSVKVRVPVFYQPKTPDVSPFAAQDKA